MKIGRTPGPASRSNGASKKTNWKVLERSLMSCSLWTVKIEAVLPPPWKQAIRGRGSSGKDIRAE